MTPANPPTKKPDIDQPDRTPAHQTRLAALLSAESDIAAKALAEVRRPDHPDAIEEARGQLERLRRQRADLDQGRGVYHDSDAGRAVRDLHDAEQCGENARWEADNANRWRQRRAAAKQAATWSTREAEAAQRRQTHYLPEAARLDGRIRHCEKTIADLVAAADKERAGHLASVTVDERAQEHQEQARPGRRRLSGPPRRHPAAATSASDPSCPGQLAHPHLAAPPNTPTSPTGHQHVASPMKDDLRYETHLPGHVTVEDKKPMSLLAASLSGLAPANVGSAFATSRSQARPKAARSAWA